MSRRIDDVDTVLVELLVHALPEAGGRSRGDRDATFLLLLHPVHDGSALMNLAHLVGQTGIEQDTLGRGRLTSVDVGNDTDIAITLEWCLSCHDGSPRCLEAVVREGLVGICHAVHVFTLLHSSALAFGGIQHFAGETLHHGLFPATARSVDQPAHGQRLAT